ncbi:hypothetical protein LCGC14_2391770, partial [marine sediment metagenome]
VCRVDYDTNHVAVHTQPLQQFSAAVIRQVEVQHHYAGAHSTELLGRFGGCGTPDNFKSFHLHQVH